MRVYGPCTSYAAKAVAGLTVLPSWRDRVDEVRLVALPGGHQSRTGGRSRVSWLVRGARRVTRGAAALMRHWRGVVSPEEGRDRA